MPKVLSINISERKGVSKHPIDKGYFKVDHGLEGDAHAGKGHRQVSLFGMESAYKMKESGMEGLCTVKFTENLTTEDIMLYELPVGTKLRVGEVLLEITQIGKECHLGCEIEHLAQDCVMPREVIFTRVLNEGWIKSGDEIIVER